ncbi:MAG: hypothetical protein ABW185_19275 [Sedimenticola sp.]
MTCMTQTQTQNRALYAKYRERNRQIATVGNNNSSISDPPLPLETEEPDQLFLGTRAPGSACAAASKV